MLVIDELLKFWHAVKGHIHVAALKHMKSIRGSWGGIKLIITYSSDAFTHAMCAKGFDSISCKLLYSCVSVRVNKWPPPSRTWRTQDMHIIHAGVYARIHTTCTHAMCTRSAGTHTHALSCCSLSLCHISSIISCLVPGRVQLRTMAMKS